MNEIDWQSRKQRALAHLEALKREWERARGKKVPPRWVEYDYRDEARREGNDGA